MREDKRERRREMKIAIKLLEQIGEFGSMIYTIESTWQKIDALKSLNRSELCFCIDLTG